MEQLIVRLLLTIAAKVVFWVGYTFLQKPNSFKFLSILEENCVAHINIEAIKCKFLLTNVSQNQVFSIYSGADFNPAPLTFNVSDQVLAGNIA